MRWDPAPPVLPHSGWMLLYVAVDDTELTEWFTAPTRIKYHVIITWLCIWTSSERSYRNTATSWNFNTEAGFILSCTWQLVISLLKWSIQPVMESLGQVQWSLIPPTNQRGHTPSCTQAQWRYSQHRVGYLVICFDSTNPPAIPWRWGWSLSLKHVWTFTSWRGCPPNNISLNDKTLLPHYKSQSFNHNLNHFNPAHTLETYSSMTPDSYHLPIYA